MDGSSRQGYKASMTTPARPRPRRLALLGLALLALGQGALSRADEPRHREDHDVARQALEQGQVLPLRSVLDKIERDHQGQVLKIEFERDDGRFVYKIRLLQKDGRMVRLKVDAVDGQVLSIQRREEGKGSDAHPGRGR